MYAMLIQVLSRQEKSDNLVEEVRDNSNRIRELEKKVGDPGAIAEKLGLCLRGLPLAEGRSELDNVRDALAQIGAPGVDVFKDVLKVERVGNTDSYIGIVKVELVSEAVRRQIMLNKKNLKFHVNETMRNLVISNLLPESDMKFVNFTRDILKMVPGGDEVYISNSGRLRQRDHINQNGFNAPQASGFHNFRAQMPPRNTSRNNAALQGYSIPSSSDENSQRFNMPSRNNVNNSVVGNQRQHTSSKQVSFSNQNQWQYSQNQPPQQQVPVHLVSESTTSHNSMGMVSQYSSAPQPRDNSNDFLSPLYNVNLRRHESNSSENFVLNENADTAPLFQPPDMFNEPTNPTVTTSSETILPQQIQHPNENVFSINSHNQNAMPYQGRDIVHQDGGVTGAAGILDIGLDQ